MSKSAKRAQDRIAKVPRDHPDAESEHSIVEVAQHVVRTLEGAGFAASSLPLGTDPRPLWPELQYRGADVVFNLFEGDRHRCISCEGG